jgi:hypothetical protein
VAEDDITIGITVEDSSAIAKLAELQSELGRVQEKARMSSGPMSGILTPVPEALGGPKGASMTPLLDAATEAAKRNAGATKELTGATNELSEASGRAGINIGSMLSRMVDRLAIMALVKLAFDAVKDAITAASQAEEEFRAIQVGTQTSIADTNKIFDSLKKTANDTGQDLEKFVVPAFNKLWESGMRAGEAAEATEAIGMAMRRTKIDISGVVEKAEQGAAAFGDMAKAGRALGAPEFSEWARSWAQAQVAEAAYSRELTHAHELMQRQIHDVEALASAHEGFAQKTGLAEAAFKSFAAAGARPTAAVAIPKALADLPGGEQAFGQLLGEMQKRFGEGMAQIGKEEHLAPRLVMAGVAAGIPGFGEADLLAAAKRAEQEKNLTTERKEQDTHAERIKAFDDARVSGNERIKQLLADETKNTNDLADATKSLGERFNDVLHSIQNIGVHLGDVAHAAQSPAPTAALEKLVEPQTARMPFGVVGRLGMGLSSLLHPSGVQSGGSGVAPGGGAQEVKETNSDKIEGHLRTISDALTGHGTP